MLKKEVLITLYIVIQNFRNFKILNSFNIEIQLRDTESAIKIKLICLLTQLKGFIFVNIFECLKDRK